MGHLKLLFINRVLRYQKTKGDPGKEKLDPGRGGQLASLPPSGTCPLMKASMFTRTMSKRLNVDALPGASVGYVGDEIVAERSDLHDYLGWQVRAPRAATCMPDDQPVECWLVGGDETPGDDGATSYATVQLSVREAAMLEHQDGTRIGMRGVPWAVEQPADAEIDFRPEPPRSKSLTCGVSGESQLGSATVAEGSDDVSGTTRGNEKPLSTPRRTSRRFSEMAAGAAGGE